MFHGLSLLPDCVPETKAPHDYFRDVLLLSRLADQGGMSHVKMTEHYLGGYGGYCPSPLAFLSAVAAATSRIRLMTGCVLPVFHHPIRLASEAAMVDAISGGDSTSASHARTCRRSSRRSRCRWTAAGSASPRPSTPCCGCGPRSGSACAPRSSSSGT